MKTEYFDLYKKYGCDECLGYKRDCEGYTTDIKLEGLAKILEDETDSLLTNKQRKEQGF